MLLIKPLQPKSLKKGNIYQFGLTQYNQLFIARCIAIYIRIYYIYVTSP